ncbi:MAG: EamA family transporter [Agathobaculum sp.]|jgi:drug/metabolite transporter (DMT)-like permease|uniref:EamA family transporter n=1 Tax=Agathobaculum sp. TaxID=2048138 RepID=UPI003D8B88CF
MWNMFWPIALVVLSNIMYNICTKSTPAGANAFLSLGVTYLTAAALSLLLYWQGAHSTLPEELRRLNWAAPVLGIMVVGLEFGYIHMYRAGWRVNTGSLVANIALSCALLAVGALLYHEVITLRQLLGIAVCAAGLFLLTY